MGEPSRKLDSKYTYADYLTWNDNKRWEIIDGIAYEMFPSTSKEQQEIYCDMSLAPSREHQTLSIKISTIFENFFKDKECKVFYAPFDVTFAEKKTKNKDINTVVQPDILVVCDEEKLNSKGCTGAPDLIIEILSPATAQKDKKEKFYLYEKFGVKEYWLVEPADKTVTVFTLAETGLFNRPDIYIDTDTVDVSLFPGLKIELPKIFK